MVERILLKFIQELHDKLKNNVFDEDDVAMINKIECLVNLKDRIKVKIYCTCEIV